MKRGISDEPQTPLEAALDKAMELIRSELEGSVFAEPGLVLLARVVNDDDTTSGACAIDSIDDVEDVKAMLVHLLVALGGLSVFTVGEG